MKIVREGKKSVKFSDLERGDVFEIYGDVYIKIDITKERDNAYNLQGNSLSCFGAEEEIIKLEAELSVW